MKKLVFAILVFFALSNFTFAKDVNFATISKADTQFLFKDKSVKIVALNENELKDTKGAWWPIFWGLTLYSVKYLNAPSINDKLYKGHPFARGKWKILNWLDW